MKKFIIVTLFIIALPCTYLAYDYASYILKPRKAIKKILIISEHIEPTTSRAHLAQIIADVAAENPHVSTTLVDVSTLGFSFLTGDDTPRQKPVEDPYVKQWSAQVAQADGFIFMVPNYNNGYSAGIKNAIDMLWKEWFNKPSALVAYSSSQPSSDDIVSYFGRVIDKIKTDPVKTVIALSPDQYNNLDNQEILASIKSSLRQQLTEVYAGTQERHYFRQLYRSVTDKILIRIIKFFQDKNKRPKR